MTEDKGFKPTEKKIREAREKGKILKSPLCSQASAMIGASLGCYGCLRYLSRDLLDLSRWTWLNGFADPVQLIAAWSTPLTIFLFFPVFAAAVFGLAAEMAQSKIEVHMSLLGINPERLNPAAGIAKMGSGLSRSWLPGVKICIILTVGYFCVQANFHHIQISPLLTHASIVTTLFRSQLNTIGALTAVFFFCSGAEYYFKRREYLRELSMSLDDIRRENKDDEGDPQQKNHRRQLAHLLLSQELVHRVRQSRVIVVEKRGKGPGQSSN